MEDLEITKIASSRLSLISELLLLTSMASAVLIVAMGLKYSSLYSYWEFNSLIAAFVAATIWTLMRVWNQARSEFKALQAEAADGATGLLWKENVFFLAFLIMLLVSELVFLGATGLASLGWDGLDFWGPASQLLREGKNPAEYLGGVAPNRHPFTTAGLLTLSSIVSEAGAPFGVVWIALRWILMIASFSVVCLATGQPTVGVIVAYLVGSMPLLVNHSLLIGYNELLTSVLLVCAYSAIVAVHFSIVARRSILAMGFLLTLGLLMVKSTTVVSVIIFCLAALACYLSVKNVTRIVVFAVLAGALALQFKWHLPIGGLGLSWWPSESTLWLGGRPMNFGHCSNKFSEVFWIFLRATLEFQSFSTSPLLSALIPFALFRLVWQRRPVELRLATLGFVLVSLHVILVAVGACTSYGFEVSISDTLFSRTLLPIFVLSCVIVGVSVAGTIRPKTG